MLIAGEKPAKFLNLSIETCNLYIDKLFFFEFLEVPNLYIKKRLPLSGQAFENRIFSRD